MERLAAFLERYKACPLTIVGPLERHRQQSLKLMVNESHRRRNVYRFEIDSAFVAALGGATLSLPLANHMVVSFHYQLLEHGTSRNSNPVIDPHLPALTALCCTASPWPVVKTWMKPTLVVLRVVGRGNPYSIRPPVEDWIDVLHSLTKLEVLILDHALARHTAGIGYMYRELERSFDLPHLQHLELRAGGNLSLNACAHLARYIHYPWQTHVEIELHLDEPTSPDLYATFFACLSFRLAPRGRAALH